MKALTVIAQQKAEAGWVHRFRNFGEDVYARLRESCEVNIAEIDAAFDEFHVNGIRDEEADVVRRAVAVLNSEHHLDDSVFITINDVPVYHQTVGLVLDTAFGERLWEIAGRHPIWVVGSDVNRAAAKQLSITAEADDADVTLWRNELAVLTEEDWFGVLNTLDMHHGVYAGDPPMNKLASTEQ